MNRPSLIVRMAGSPIAAFPLTLGGMWLIFIWAQGHTTVWVALIGCFVTVKTISAARQRRAYNAWHRHWESVGTFGKKPPRRRPIRPWRWATFLASMLFIGSLVFLPQAANNSELQNAMMWFWLCCGIFLAARLVIGVGRMVIKRRNKNAGRTKPDASPVSWRLGSTLDAPSREMAVKNLPEYAARILSR